MDGKTRMARRPLNMGRFVRPMASPSLFSNISAHFPSGSDTWAWSVPALTLGKRPIKFH